MMASLITVSLPDSGTVNWILLTLLVIHLGLDALTFLSPLALRYFASWCVARAAAIDASHRVMTEVKHEEWARLGLPVANRRSPAPTASRPSGPLGPLRPLGPLGPPAPFSPDSTVPDYSSCSLAEFSPIHDRNFLSLDKGKKGML